MVLHRVMHTMKAPEKIRLVMPAMQPIPCEVIHDKKHKRLQEPGPGRHARRDKHGAGDDERIERHLDKGIHHRPIDQARREVGYVTLALRPCRIRRMHWRIDAFQNMKHDEAEKEDAHQCDDRRRFINYVFDFEKRFQCSARALLPLPHRKRIGGNVQSSQSDIVDESRVTKPFCRNAVSYPHSLAGRGLG